MKPENINAVIDTQRLHLRIARPGDGVQVYRAVAESLDNLREWPTSLPWARYEPSVEASEKFCQDSANEYATRTGFSFLAFDETSHLIGSVGLHSVRWDIPSMEIGFWIRRSAQRKGFAAEAVTAVLDFALAQLQARRVQARTDEDNHVCRATCHAAGMKLEGILVNERITPAGELKNGCVYSRIS